VEQNRTTDGDSDIMSKQTHNAKMKTQNIERMAPPIRLKREKHEINRKYTVTQVEKLQN
jgi:hypothetical protein